MKNSIIIILLLNTWRLFAQNSLGKMDDLSRLSLKIANNHQIEGITIESRNALNNKLNSILLKGNLGSSSYSRFIIVPNIVITSKDITPTAPPKYVYKMDINLYIGDGIDGTLFAHTDLQVSGVGDTETKAYISAIGSINANNQKVKDFITEGKNKIIQYYNTKCDMLIVEARTSASGSQYEKALYILSSIPDACMDCYNKTQPVIAEIYKQKIDFECKETLMKARAAWQQSQNRQSANEAAKYLREINPIGSCYEDAVSLNKEISDRIFQIDKMEWDYKMKKQNDETELSKQIIKAARDIGVAYGENQPERITTYNYVLWW